MATHGAALNFQSEISLRPDEDSHTKDPSEGALFLVLQQWNKIIVACKERMSLHNSLQRKLKALDVNIIKVC